MEKNFLILKYSRITNVNRIKFEVKTQFILDAAIAQAVTTVEF
jgi:hypothetical protein